MASVLLLIPGMLYYNLSNIKKYDEVILLEEIEMFSEKYSDLRVKYNRDCMKAYSQYLKSNSIKVRYIDIQHAKQFYTQIEHSHRQLLAPPAITTYNPLDRAIQSRWDKIEAISKPYLHPHNFILSSIDIDSNDFRRLRSVYEYTSKKLRVPLMKSTDKYNRSRVDMKTLTRDILATDTPPLPVNHQDALKSLKKFLHRRLQHFAVNQDSIEREYKRLHHSCLSIPLNMGLLTPVEVIQTTKRYYSKHVKNDKSKHVPYNSYEAFMRQILGWREYMFYLYMKHRDYMTASMESKPRTPIPSSWFNGTTKHVILNTEILKALETSYSHHIVRLMVFMCLMQLYRLHPEDIIRWFKRVVSMDAYDWIMVSNVYAMGYYVRNFTSKSYLCSSAYITRMSRTYKRDALWDELYRKRKQ